MGTLSYILFLAVAMAFVNEAACHCPPRSKVPGYRETCTGDYDCRHGMVCCPNWSNTKSCVYPAPYSHRISVNYGFSRPLQGTRKFCDGMKCMPYEVCKHDYDKRLKCQLP